MMFYELYQTPMRRSWGLRPVASVSPPGWIQNAVSYGETHVGWNGNTIILAAELIDSHGLSTSVCTIRYIVRKNSLSGMRSWPIMRDSQGNCGALYPLFLVRPSPDSYLATFRQLKTFLNFLSRMMTSVTFLPPATAMINCFQLYTEADMSRIITAAPSKSCDLDPLPTDILRQFLHRKSGTSAVHYQDV